MEAVEVDDALAGRAAALEDIQGEKMMLNLGAVTL